MFQQVEPDVRGRLDFLWSLVKIWKTYHNILIFRENVFPDPVSQRISTVNGPFVYVVLAEFRHVEIAYPDGDCLGEFVPPVFLLVFAQGQEFLRFFHLLLALDNHERLVEDCSVYKEPVFRPLHLNIQHSPGAGCCEYVHYNLPALRDPESSGVVEGVFEALDLVVAMKVEESVKKVLESVFAVEEFLKTGVVFRVDEHLAD